MVLRVSINCQKPSRFSISETNGEGRGPAIPRASGLSSKAESTIDRITLARFISIHIKSRDLVAMFSRKWPSGKEDARD